MAESACSTSGTKNHDEEAWLTDPDHCHGEGHALVRESTKEKNGFTVWEAEYQAHVRGDDVIFHDFFLFADGLLVEVSLGTRKEDYDSYVGDLVAVVNSVRQANLSR